MSHSSPEHGAVTNEEAIEAARKGLKACQEGCRKSLGVAGG